MKNKRIFLLLTTIANSLILTLCCYLPYPSKYSYGVCDSLSKFLVTRPGWDAKEPTGPLECLWGPVDYVIIHHTMTAPATDFKSCVDAVQNLQKQHMTDNKWLDIGYHFVICGDGKVYEGRPWYKVGAHTKYHNKISIGIALVGNFDKDCPDPKMLDLIPKLAYCGAEKGYVSPDFQVIGHRDAYCTACPGDALYKILRKWPRFPDIVPIPSYTCDATESPKPETTTTPATTTTTTTAAPTTEPPTTQPPTTLPPTTTKEPDHLFYYVLLSKMKIPWLKGNTSWSPW